MLAMLVMATTSAIVIAMVDMVTLQMTAIRNTSAWDKARYMAEAGIADGLCQLENDNAWRTGITSTEFPTGSGNTYSLTITDPGTGTLTLTATGISGGFTRKVEATVVIQ
jgi:type II secretory pathway component PulK